MNSMVKSQDKTDSWFFFLNFTDGSKCYQINFCNFESTQNLRTCFAEKNKALKKTCRMKELRKQVPFFSQGGSVWYASVSCSSQICVSETSSRKNITSCIKSNKDKINFLQNWALNKTRHK